MKIIFEIEDDAKFCDKLNDVINALEFVLRRKVPDSIWDSLQELYEVLFELHDNHVEVSRECTELNKVHCEVIEIPGRSFVFQLEDIKK